MPDAPDFGALARAPAQAPDFSKLAAAPAAAPTTEQGWRQANPDKADEVNPFYRSRKGLAPASATSGQSRFLPGEETDYSRYGGAFGTRETEALGEAGQRENAAFREQHPNTTKILSAALSPARVPIETTADLIRRQGLGGDLENAPTGKVADEIAAGALSSGAAVGFAPVTVPLSPLAPALEPAMDALHTGAKAVGWATAGMKDAPNYVPPGQRPPELPENKTVTALTEIAAPLLLGKVGGDAAGALRDAAIDRLALKDAPALPSIPTGRSPALAPAPPVAEGFETPRVPPAEPTFGTGGVPEALKPTRAGLVPASEPIVERVAADVRALTPREAAARVLEAEKTAAERADASGGTVRRVDEGYGEKPETVAFNVERPGKFVQNDVGRTPPPDFARLGRPFDADRTAGTGAPETPPLRPIRTAPPPEDFPGTKPLGAEQASGSRVDVSQPAEPQSSTSPKPYRPKGRPMSSEAGAIAVPQLKPLPEVLPPGTPAERAAVADVKERIRFGEEPKPPLVDRALDLAKKAQSELVRREAPLRRAEKDLTGAESPTGPTAQAKFAQGSADVASKNLYEHGVLDEKTVPAVETALKDVVKAGRRFSDVSAYAKAKREAVDYTPNNLDVADPAANDATVALYERDHPSVVKAADAIAETNRALRANFAEADRWDPARLADMEARNKYPIQLQRDFGIDEPTAGTTKGAKGPMAGSPFRKRTGSSAPTRDPLTLLRENFRRSIAAADQARVKHSFLDMLKNAPPAKAAALAEEMTPAQLKAAIPDFDAIAAHMNPTADPGDFGKTFEAYDRAYKAGIVPVETPGGGTKFLKVHDPALATALKGGDLVDANALLKAAGVVTAIQRTGITQVSPTFLPRNFVRDIGTYVAQAKETNDVKLWTNLARGMYHAVRGELEHVGVTGTPFNEAARRARMEGFYEADTTKSAPTKIARMEEGLVGYYARRPLSIPKGVVGTAFDMWKSLNSGIEHGPRYAALIDDLEAQGWKPGQPLSRDMLVRAGNSAQEATVNFRLGGDTGKAVNRYVFNFFNPAVQGAEQLRQTFANRPGLATRRAITYGAAPALASYLYWQSDDKKKAAWERMTPWRRAQMNFPMEDKDGNVRVLSLPVAQEAGAIYSAVTAAADAIGHSDPSRFGDQFKEIAGRLSPVPWYPIPSVIEPIAENVMGRHNFSGREINPRSMKGGELVAPQDVRQPYSSQLGFIVSKFLHEHAAWTGWKPTTAEIDNLVSGYGGTAARDVIRTAPGGETEAADAPMVGGFFPRMSESKFTDDYYKLRDTYEGQTNLARALKKKDAPEARRLALPSGISDDVAKIDGALRAARDRYHDAPEHVRPAIAAHMDNLAKSGLRLLTRAGTGAPKPYRPKNLQETSK